MRPFYPHPTNDKGFPGATFTGDDDRSVFNGRLRPFRGAEERYVTMPGSRRKTGHSVTILSSEKRKKPVGSL